jgi:ABC-type nitrate/sulfonate/bicarbonate transport system permease component
MRRLKGLAGLCVLLVVWWWVPEPRGAIPPLGDVLRYGYDALLNRSILVDVGLSIRRIIIGAATGIVAAVVLGAACVIPLVRGMVAGPLELARPVPPIAWIPLAIVLFGVGEPSAVALVALAVFFPVILAIILALDSIDKDLVLAARSLGAGAGTLARHVYLPSMFPIVVTGIRIGVGIGWFSVVAAEMVGSYRGLGYGIQIASLNLEMERFFVYLMLIGICGFAMNAALLWVHHYFTSWQDKRSAIE